RIESPRAVIRSRELTAEFPVAAATHAGVLIGWRPTSSSRGTDVDFTTGLPSELPCRRCSSYRVRLRCCANPRASQDAQDCPDERDTQPVSVLFGRLRRHHSHAWR